MTFLVCPASSSSTLPGRAFAGLALVPTRFSSLDYSVSLSGALSYAGRHPLGPSLILPCEECRLRVALSTSILILATTSLFLVTKTGHVAHLFDAQALETLHYAGLSGYGFPRKFWIYRGHPLHNYYVEPCLLVSYTTSLTLRSALTRFRTYLRKPCSDSIQAWVSGSMTVGCDRRTLSDFLTAKRSLTDTKAEPY